MDFKKGVSIIFILIVISMVSIYFFLPLQETNFNKNLDSNFNLNNSETRMQFYPEMRFSDSTITYKIDEYCSLKKQNEMEEAFLIIENLTVLDFEPVNFQEEIFITCETENRVEDGLFIAGEGGPTKIVSSGNYNVIYSGNILLIRNSRCPNPNVPIHELLHVLGFNHSENPGNIMYPISECSQTIGDDMVDEINRLYSVEPLPDLYFENITGEVLGKYVNLEFIVRNGGLRDSKNSTVQIYFDSEEKKSLSVSSLEVGTGITIDIKNLYKGIKNIKEMKIEIVSNFEEMDKSNNLVILDI
jgi:hypothetical protein